MRANFTYNFLVTRQNGKTEKERFIKININSFAKNEYDHICTKYYKIYSKSLGRCAKQKKVLNEQHEIEKERTTEKVYSYVDHFV